MDHAGSYDEAWRRAFERAAREQREAAEQASRAGALTGAPLLCEQRWCETAEGPAPATVGLARCDGNGAWLSCDACAARMLGDARYAVQVVSIDQWRQVSSQREQQIAAQIAAAKTGHGVVSLPGSAGGQQARQSPAAPVPVPAPRAPQDGYQSLPRAKPWLIAAAVSIVVGLFCVIVGAEENSPNVSGTPGAPALWIGGILIVVPILATAASILVSAARFGAEQARRYRAWKMTLTPEQLTAVRMAEAAATFVALEGAHIAMRHSNERMHARYAAQHALHEQRRREHQERMARIQAMQDTAAGYGPAPAVWQQGLQPRMWRQP